MKPGGPENFTADNEAFLPVGYSISRIRGLTSNERTDIRELTPVYNDFRDGKTQLDVSNLLASQEVRIQMETSALTSMFIPGVWSKVRKWIKANPPGLATPEAFSLVLSPVKEEELMNEIADTNTYDAVNIIAQHTTNILKILTLEWYNEQEKKQRQNEPEEGEDRKMWMAYQRYKKILMLGMSNVKKEQSEGGNSVRSPEEHIRGGFGTAYLMIWRSLKILPKVFEQAAGRPIKKEELKNFVTGTHPLILAIASTTVEAMNAIQLELVEPTNNLNRSIEVVKRDFDPSRFSISKKGNNIYLEIKPEVLDKIKLRLSKSSGAAVHTGCPALFANGDEGKNVVSEMYDWCAELYEKFYINSREKYE